MGAAVAARRGRVCAETVGLYISPLRDVARLLSVLAHALAGRMPALPGEAAP